jgi:ribosomal protein L14, bacterial/organelle
MCVNILGGSGRRYAHVGDVIVGTIKKAVPGGSVKAGDVVRAVVIRTTKPQRRADGTYIRFDDNAGVVIDKQGLPRGTRILGPIAREVKEAGYNKIASLAREVV